LRTLEEHELSAISGGHGEGYETFVLQNAASCLKPEQGLKFSSAGVPGPIGVILKIGSMFDLD
jgi:hypothetical protein